jgi:dTDP-4-amino-4,6-dideoxygalactose transaminase
MGLSPSSLENWLIKNAIVTSDGDCRNRITGRRIKACVPMHTFGHPVKIDNIIEICDRNIK